MLLHRPFFACFVVWILGLPIARSAPVPNFRHVTIDDRVAIGYGLALADMDGDGKTDIVLADKQAIVWYRNPEWRRLVMVERLTELDHVCVAARDIDGDGKAEVAAGAGWNPGDTISSGALFYLNAPVDRTQKWEPIRLAHDPTIHRIRWVKNRKAGFDLVSVPLHGRGNRNGVGDGVRILAYHPPRDVKSAWTSTELNADWHATHNFDVLPRENFDPLPGEQPGSEELRVASREGVFMLMPEAGSWPIAAAGETPEFVGAGEVRAGRFGAAGQMVATIEPMHGNQVVVYRPRPEEAGARWRRTVIDGTLVDGHGLACADFLGQGRDQVLAGWRAMNAPGKPVGIRLYVSTDDAGTQWERHVVDDNQMACEDLQVADLDGDGDLDVVASGRGTKNVKIYFNETRKP